MDRTTDLTDAFVEVKFADYEAYRTQICRRTLNPVWNEDFRFEVSDDSDLQNEPLELKTMDYDQISYNDSIGTIFIDLNPLLAWDSPAQITGWFPIYDTLLGLRGELNVQVKLQMFGDINPFKDSSAGVQFFTLSAAPETHQVVSVLGFVSTLDREDDPEYHWTDNFRTPRKSNEARTRIMFRLSGHIRRQLGKKVIELNGNAVLGFKQFFDLESETRTITARAIGTAVRIVSADNNTPTNINQLLSSSSIASPALSLPHTITGNSPVLSPTQIPLTEMPNSQISAALSPPSIHNSDTHLLVPTASPPLLYNLGTSVNSNIGNSVAPEKQRPSAVDKDSHSNSVSNPDLPAPALPSQWRSSDQMSLTLEEFPPGAILAIGGLVSAISVKVLDKNERDNRSAWWNELRDEIKLHARTLRCPYIVGYTEQVSINDELAIFHCSGTAALIDLSMKHSRSLLHGSDQQALFQQQQQKNVSQECSEEESPQHLFQMDNHHPTESQVDASIQSSLSAVNLIENKQKISANDVGNTSSATPPLNIGQQSLDRIDESHSRRPSKIGSQMNHEDAPQTSASRSKRYRKTNKFLSCRASHITYKRSETPFPMSLVRCAICKKNYVPEVLLTTIELPSELETVGKGVFIEALVCRQKKLRIGELRANNASESIPFAQYDIHRQLMYKLRMYGMNAVFGLNFQISVGENLMTAVATGTAVYIRSLPMPPALKVLRNLDVVDEEDEKLMDLQRCIMTQSEANRKRIREALDALESAELEDLDKKSNDGGDSDTNSHSSSSDTDDDNESMIVGSLGTSNVGGVASMGRPSQHQRGVVVQIDDEQDEDLVLFLDHSFPEGFELCNTQTLPNADSAMKPLCNFQMVTMVKQANIDLGSHHPNRQLSGIFRTLYKELQCQLSYFSPCVVAGIRYNIQLPKEQTVQICLQAMAIGGLPLKRRESIGLQSLHAASMELFQPAPKAQNPFISMMPFRRENTHGSINSDGSRSQYAGTTRDEEEVYDEQEEAKKGGDGVRNSANQGTPRGNTSTSDRQKAEVFRGDSAAANIGDVFRTSTAGLQRTLSFPQSVSPFNAGPNVTPSINIEISPLSYIPQAKVKQFLGRMSLHFIKEASLIFDGVSGNNGMGGFTHILLAELLAVVKAHTSGLGGNAILGFSMDQVLLSESLKNQGYAMISISGDVVQVEYNNARTACVGEVMGNSALNSMIPNSNNPKTKGSHPSVDDNANTTYRKSAVVLDDENSDNMGVPQTEFAAELFYRAWR